MENVSGRGNGRRGGEGEGREGKGRDPNGLLTPHVRNPEKYPGLNTSLVQKYLNSTNAIFQEPQICPTLRQTHDFSLAYL